MIAAEDRPPYLQFSYQPVEDRNETIAKGHYCTKDLAFVTVNQPGTRDNVVKEAEVWLREQKEYVRKGRLPQRWYEAYEAAYLAWKAGEEIPPEGTAIKTWPVLSPQAAKDIIAAGFLTVEDLANAPDNQINTIGTGAMMYKQKAKTWLEQAAGPGKIIERMNAMEVEMAALKARNQDLEAAQQAQKIAAVLK
jgi:hypothetical protein